VRGEDAGACLRGREGKVGPEKKKKGEGGRRSAGQRKLHQIGREVREKKERGLAGRIQKAPESREKKKRGGGVQDEEIRIV